MALAVYDAEGKLLWQDKTKGAHPRAPAAADLDGDGTFEVVADDHGYLRIYSSAGKPVGQAAGWPPAYTLPIIGPFGTDQTTSILRASGIQALVLINARAQNVWQKRCAIWHYHRSLAAVGDVTGKGNWALAALGENGVLDCYDIGSGNVRWALKLEEMPDDSPVVAGDLDGDGRGEFLVGLPNGSLVCAGERDGQGRILWKKDLDASVSNPIIADLDGDGSAEILLSTSDGYVRVLR